MKINLAKIKQYCKRNVKKYPHFPMTLVDCKSDATKYLHIARASVRQAEYHKYLTAHHLVDLYIAQCIYHEATKQRDKSIADLYRLKVAEVAVTLETARLPGFAQAEGV